MYLEMIVQHIIHNCVQPLWYATNGNTKCHCQKLQMFLSVNKVKYKTLWQGLY
jgi:hypothetical protein